MECVSIIMEWVSSAKPFLLLWTWGPHHLQLHCFLAEEKVEPLMAYGMLTRPATLASRLRGVLLLFVLWWV